MKWIYRENIRVMKGEIKGMEEIQFLFLCTSLYFLLILCFSILFNSPFMVLLFLDISRIISLYFPSSIDFFFFFHFFIFLFFFFFFFHSLNSFWLFFVCIFF